MSSKSMIVLAPLLLFIMPSLCAQQLTLRLYKSDWDDDKDLPRCVSGIDWCEKEQKLYLVSDQKDKIYRCNLTLAGDDKDQYKFEVSKMESFSVRGIYEDCNLEAIRVSDNGEIYVSAERGDGILESFLWKGKIRDDKVVLENIPLPKSFQGKQFGRNSGIEAITFSSDRNGLWIINERAFKKTPYDSLTMVLQEFNKNETAYAYLMKNTHPDHGVSEILCFDKMRLLSLERHYSSVMDSVFADIFMITINQQVVNRTLLLSLNSLDVSHIDNYEGMCFGPLLKNGNRSLILISDNNRDWQDCKGQRTDVLVFEIKEERTGY